MMGAGLARAEEELRVDEAAFARERELLQHGPPEELEREVHVADTQAEEGADQVVVAEGVERAHQAFRRAVEPVGGDDVGLLVFEQAHRPRQLLEVDGKVGVGIEDEVLGGGGVAGAQGPSQTAVHGVVHHAHARVRARERVGQRRRPVRGGVVDDHDLPVRDPGRLQHLARRVHRAADVGLLVVHGEDDADGRRTYSSSRETTNRSNSLRNDSERSPSMRSR